MEVSGVMGGCAKRWFATCRTKTTDGRPRYHPTSDQRSVRRVRRSGPPNGLDPGGKRSGWSIHCRPPVQAGRPKYRTYPSASMTSKPRNVSELT